MAGTRNHYLPVFLQEGFASKITEKQTYLWACRKSKGPYWTTAESTGVEGHFYIDNGDPAADDTITAYESQILSLVGDLRTIPAGPADHVKIPELIAHLEMRSRNFRKTFSQFSEEIATGICDRFKDRDFALKTVHAYFVKNPGAILDNVKQTDEYRKAPTRIQKAKLREAKKISPMKLARACDWSEVAKKIAEGYSSEIPAAAKRGHLRALRDGPAPKKRVEAYTGFKFRLVDFKDQSLILGDSAVFFRLSNGRHPFRPFTDSSMEIERVYLPLSPSRLLVGSRKEGNELDSDLPHAAAKCAIEFVVSHMESDFLKNVRTSIGEYAKFFDKADIDEIISQSIAGV
jgi:hypothetical protein